jgi:AtzE family amidohydrolase
MSEITDLGPLQLSAAVRDRRLTAEAITRATLERIETHNAAINAYTRLYAEDALMAAWTTDRAIAAGRDPGPLAGATFGAKDLYDVAGKITTAGAKLRANAAPASADAFVVAALKRAGATLLGHQNMDEFAYGFSTENAHSGPTHNPHDRSRLAGGSSGGSAASVAAGLASAAIGSDTNGSIRVPAAFCGVFGLKPTFGRLSRHGVFPFVHSLDHVGPFARTAADLAALYDVMQGADPLDPGQAHRSIEPALPGIADANGLRIAALGGYFRETGTSEALAAVDVVGQALGASAKVELPEAHRARSAAFCLSAAEGGSLHLADLSERFSEYDPNVGLRLAAGAMLPAGLVMRAQRFRRWFRDATAETFSRFDVLLAPATPFAAPPIGQAMIEIGGKSMSVRANAGLYTQPISFIGLPVVAVPINAPGQLPVGVQLIGPPWSEARLLALAHRLELAGVVKARLPSELPQ